MSFFGSSDKSATASKKIRPIVVRTQNVAKEIIALAKTHNTKVEDIDFNIFEVQTYVRTNADGRESEWEEISANELYELDEKKEFLNPNFQIKQMYEIELLHREDEEDIYKDFHLAVGANATKCKVYLSIKQGSKVEYNHNFTKDLFLMINKRKVRAGILINIFDEMLNDAVSKISAHVRVEESVVYDKSETILIAQSYEPTATIDDHLILHYNKEQEKVVQENEKIDHSARGFINSVIKEELLIEYIKPQMGKPGRNCRGEYMLPKEPVVKNVPTFTIDDTIRMVEDEVSVKYIANINGYISHEGTTYTIKKEMDIATIDFKSTGSISAGLDSDVTISVKESDSEKDAIGNGMEVEVTEINVDGNVGAGAKINAIKAVIQGQTHTESMVRAENLRINIHKGAAYGKQVFITRLEHGIVDCDEVTITQATGGNIRAKEITIEICTSHVKATASRLIEIKKLLGGENVFTIDPLLKKDARASLDKNKHQIAELELEVKDMRKEILKDEQLVEENMAAFNDVKKRLMHYKKNGVKMPESFVKQYKHFTAIQETLSNLKKECEIKQDKLALLNAGKTSLQENIFDARIINRSPWTGYNELRFKLVNPPVELKYFPKEGSQDNVFGLVEVSDGQFEIQVMEQ
ncbi:MAG: flagellar assembly protein A [Sulfurimonas sp.]|jgi:hypothetical protein